MLLIALLSASLQAQEPLRVSTRLVQVSVVVRGDGKLTKDDFRVLDNGKERPIAVFSKWDRPPGLSSRVPQHVSVLLLDALNTRPEQHARAKEQAIRALDRLPAGSQVALYVLGARLRVLHDFTDDAAHLREALKAWRESNVADLNPARSGLGANAAVAGTSLGRMAADANTSTSEAYASNRADETLAAFHAIARHVRSIPGRKNVVWVSGSFPLDVASVGRGGRNYAPEAQSVARALNDADVAIYPVHTAGLQTGSGSNVDVGARGRRPVARATPMPTDPKSMRDLADDTGGRAFFQTNDVAGAVLQAIEDAESSYTLGFYVPEESLDGRYHEIKVQVKGRQARHRRGYLADPAPPGDDLQAALRSPFPSTAVGLRVRAGKADSGLPILVTIDIDTLLLEANGDRRSGTAEMILAQLGAGGALLKGSSDNLNLDLTPDQFAAMRRDGILIPKTVALDPGARQLRVLVRDKRSGRIGSVHLSLP